VGVEQSDTEAMAWFVKSAATYAADDKQPKSGILVWLRAASRVKNPDNQVQLVVLALCQATSGTDKFGSIDAYGNVSRNLLLLRTVEGVAPTRDAVFAALERLEVARKNYFQGAFELYGQPGYFPQHLKTGVHHLEQALSQGLWEAGFHLLAYYKSVGEAGAWLNTLHRMHALLSSNWDDEKANAVITRLLAKISIPENLIPDNDMGGAFTPADASQQDLYALAGSGLSYAQYLLGRRLLVQETDPDRVQEGLRWVEQAAQGGAEEAQLLLATHYLEGRGVPQDDTKALEWLQRAVRQGGSPEPYYRLGILYENGQGVARNDEVALTWYRRASGYVPAMLAERFWSAQQGGAGPESSTLVAGLIALQRWYPLVSPELPDFLRSHAWLRSFDALEWREALTKLDAGFAQLVEGVLVSDGILLPRDTRKGVLLLEGALREGYIDAGIELLKLYRMEDAPQQWARIAGDVMRLARRHERPKILWELLAEVTKDQIPPNEALPPHAHLLPWRPLYQALAKKGWPYAQRITQWLGAAPLVGDGEASGQGESDAIPSDQPRRAAMPRHVPVESVTEAAVSGAWQDEIAELEGKLERLHNDLFSEPYINYETINDISSKTYHLALLYLASGDQDKLIDLAVRQLAAVRAAHIGEEGRDDGFFGLLSESCHWSRYGSILYTAGLPEASLFFYKQSVNRLQQARPYLKDFPVPVRECFLKYYEERYRQLADLFIEQGHLAEAEFVIGLLKDNEVAEFVRGANGAGDKTLAQLPLTAAEATLQSAFNAMHQDLFAENRRLAELRNKKKAQGELSEEERREIEALQALVRDGGRVFGEHMRGIKDRFAALERKENAWTAEEIDASLGSVRVTLKKLAQGGAGEVVAIHTVVLADGIHLLVSNRDTQVARFSPVNRNELIGIVASLRQALATPYWDPTPSARRLYEVLIAPILADIQGAQATTLVWSLDHILRYVPLAVLHDGEHHLFQKYQLAMLTNASRDRLVTTSPQEFEIGGFGVSAAGRGFDELRFVPLELDGIVKKSDDDLFGVAPGNYWLDSDFTKNELELALPEYPIIHIASHFSLTPGSYDKSFLLLGDGSDLSLKEIVDYRMDFSGVDLLVLSACSTALGGADMDGGEVQSFAEIAHGYGASSIIATLWPVADASTSLFMQEFYRRQGGGQSKAQALQAVQEDFLNNRVAVTATLRDRAKARGLDLDPVAHVARPAGSIYPGYSHPYYWAPFVLMGNWL
jgi:CHAT domain-containing protein/TPR repeat protein